MTLGKNLQFNRIPHLRIYGMSYHLNLIKKISCKMAKIYGNRVNSEKIKNRKNLA